MGGVREDIITVHSDMRITELCIPSILVVSAGERPSKLASVFIHRERQPTASMVNTRVPCLQCEPSTALYQASLPDEAVSIVAADELEF